jgi:tRNA uridine 5-carboxymethylaminomethyl modification enzyme
VEIYVNGFSTSLPDQVQHDALKQIAGFENVKMFRPGYAIEYDYFPPTQLDHTLQTKLIGGLFFAGQINGTTGYEEAAAQGLIAGMNAHMHVQDQDMVTLKRSEAYIGVLIDDLINKGTDEPYRMFTSRAEFRTLLRQDNADLRLTALSHKLGLASDQRLENVEKKQKSLEEIDKYVKTTSVSPDTINDLLTEKGTASLDQKVKLTSLVSRPQLSMPEIIEHVPEFTADLAQFSSDEIEQAEIRIKYQGYIDKEIEMAEKLSRLESLAIGPEIDFSSIVSLSHEAKEKLTKVRPSTIGQASRISGVTPSDVSVLMVHLGR